MAVVEGYAVTHNGIIDVRTVSDSERAAKVNFLFAHAKIAVGSTVTDAGIAKLWIDLQKRAAASKPAQRVDVIKVMVMPKQGRS